MFHTATSIGPHHDMGFRALRLNKMTSSVPPGATMRSKPGEPLISPGMIGQTAQPSPQPPGLLVNFVAPLVSSFYLFLPHRLF